MFSQALHLSVYWYYFFSQWLSGSSVREFSPGQSLELTLKKNNMVLVREYKSSGESFISFRIFFLLVSFFIFY